jgi:hypothetical protein
MHPHVAQVRTYNRLDPLSHVDRDPSTAMPGKNRRIDRPALVSVRLHDVREFVGEQSPTRGSSVGDAISVAFGRVVGWAALQVRLDAQGEGKLSP